MDPSQQINMRYRLYGQAIHRKGQAQMKTLQPYFQGRLEKTFERMVDPQLSDDGTKNLPVIENGELTILPGWSSIQIAPIMRDLATGMLGTYLFGDKLCRKAFPSEPSSHSQICSPRTRFRVGNVSIL